MRPEIRVKNIKSQSLLHYQTNTVVKFIIKQQVFPHCTPTHRTESSTTSHYSLKIQSVFKPFHKNMVRSAEERFAMERMATLGFGSMKIAAASRNIGRPRGAEAGECVMFSLHVSSHIFRRVICVSRLWVHGWRVRAAALINAWISLDPCCTVAGVRLASSGAAAASMCAWRRSTGQRTR